MYTYSPAVQSPFLTLSDRIARRRKLVLVALHAWRRWSDACDLYWSRKWADSPSLPCIQEAFQRAERLLRRYERLESLLSEEAGVSASTCYNTLANWTGCCPALVANL